MSFIFLRGYSGISPGSIRTAFGLDWDNGCHNPMLAISVDSRFPFAVLPECCSCPCFFSGVFSLTLRKRSHRKNRIPFSRSFNCQSAKKKPIHRNIKNQREFFSRFKMMKLCIGFEIQIRGICLLTNHAGRQCGIGWCGNVRLPLSSNRSFILYSVVALIDST